MDNKLKIIIFFIKNVFPLNCQTRLKSNKLGSTSKIALEGVWIVKKYQSKIVHAAKTLNYA